MRIKGLNAEAKEVGTGWLAPRVGQTFTPVELVERLLADTDLLPAADRIDLSATMALVDGQLIGRDDKIDPWAIAEGAVCAVVVYDIEANELVAVDVVFSTHICERAAELRELMESTQAVLDGEDELGEAESEMPEEWLTALYSDGVKSDRRMLEHYDTQLGRVYAFERYNF